MKQNDAQERAARIIHASLACTPEVPPAVAIAIATTVSNSLVREGLLLGNDKLPVMQQWTWGLPLMQQTVLLTAMRGPDGIAKYHPIKYLLRWMRRCVLLSAMDHRVLEDPYQPGGGSFAGPSVDTSAAQALGLLGWGPATNRIADKYVASLDEIPHHFQLHFMHAAEIIGYKHPTIEIKNWWQSLYVRLVHDMHLWPETREQMDERLSDDREAWLAREDRAIVE